MTKLPISSAHTDEISVLDARDHIRMRKEMYVGEAADATHLAIEVIDNAVDELMNGHGTIMEVVSDPKGSYVVRDTGRGIPLTSSKLVGQDVPIVLATTINSSGKFSHNMYAFSRGLHGIGLTACNMLSEWMTITTLASPKTYVEYIFRDGLFVSKTEIPRNGSAYSTMVSFKPDKRFFKTPTCDMSYITEQLRVVKNGLGDNARIIINGSEIEDTFMSDFMAGSVGSLSGSASNAAGEMCELFVALVDPDHGKEFVGIVNFARSDDGTHMRSSTSYVKDALFELAQKRKLHVGRPEDILTVSKIMCRLKIKDVAFHGQTKGKLATNREHFDALVDAAVRNMILKCPTEVETWLGLAEQYRIELDTKRKTNKRKTGRTVTIEGLRECTSDDVSKRELYLLEGESAGGTIAQCRDSSIHAFLALRGKVLNTHRAHKAAIVANDVISNVCGALGYQPCQYADPAKCRYNSVHIMADADPDGRHITALLITMFYTLMPDLIKAGKVFIVDTPLYGIWVNKAFVPIYTEEMLAKYDRTKVTRYKGLGEMDPNELYYTALDPRTRRLRRLVYEEIDLKVLWGEIGRLKMDSDLTQKGDEHA